MPLLSAARRQWTSMKDHLPPFNFITLHYTYFIATCLLFAIIFWGSSTPARSVSFTDSLFLTVSAMTLAGLNTINLSTLNTFQQFLLFALIMLGSAIWVSAWVVLIRRHAFEKKFEDVVRARRQKRGRSLSISRLRARSSTRDAEKAAPTEDSQDPSTDSTSAVIEDDAPLSSPRARAITFDDRPRRISELHPVQRRRLKVQDEPYRPMTSVSDMSTDQLSRTTSRTGHYDIGRYFESVGGWVSRNSEFHGLTEHEREKLGGYEYRAVSLLAWLVPAYYVLWQLLGALGCAAWVANNQPDAAYTNGLNPWWVGAFNAISAFNNSGMSLLDANMVAFQTSYYLLITMSLLILAGNTCYPVFLRLIVWSMYKTASLLPGPNWEERTKTLRFLLDHPRRCYTNLFPAAHTWWLLATVVLLNGIDWAAFEILNIGNSLLDNALPTNIRVIDGLFQAFAVRSGGFYVVVIPNLRIALLVLYVIMMYISPYPVVITMRSSNVYEERSLGIYADDPAQDSDEKDTDDNTAEPSRGQLILRRAGTTIYEFLAGASAGTDNPERSTHFVRQQLRAQLSHDAWVLALALLLIMIIENQSFVNDPVNFSVFNVIFELVSGYGTVGISIGVPYDAYSFCGSWTTLSKLILCFVMLKGRHRGLPVAIDKAILLPGEASELAEEEDGRIRMRSRSFSRREVV